MIRIRKIAIAIIAGSALLLILLLAGVLIVPKLVDMEVVRNKVSRELTKRVGVEIDFEQIDLSVFPAPHVSLYKSKVVLPQRLTASVEAINVYPEILPLLGFKINIKELQVHRPDLTITLQKAMEKERTLERPQPVREFVQKVASTVTALPELHIPDIDSRIRGGSIKLIHGNEQVLEFHHVDGHLTDVSNRIIFEMTGASDIGKTATVSGWLNPRQMRISMRMVLTQLRSQVVYDMLFPNAAIEIRDARPDLTIDLNLDGPSQIQADIDLSVPQLVLAHGDETAAIQEGKLKGSIQINDNLAMISLSELVLASPKMKVSGRLVSSFDDPQLRLQLEGRDIELGTTQQAVLAILGTHDVTRRIFEIVKKATAPKITVGARGASLSDLVNLDNLIIRAQVNNADVHVPDVSLNLEDVSGDILVSRGILEGTHIEARLGKSSVQNGSLTLGLSGDARLLHLEADLQADLSELPPMLKRLIDHKSFQKELALVKDVKGNANGKLVVDKDTGNVNVTVEASDIHLTARYLRTPFPVEITGGQFTYNENRIGLKQFGGTLGKSSFSELSAALGLKKNPDLDISAGRSRLYLSEIVPWLSTYSKLGDLPKYYGGGKSILTLSAIHLKGPLLSPRYWHFNLSGATENLVLKNLPQHPAPVTIASAKFTIDPQVFVYTDAQVTLLDSVLKISGRHNGYLDGFEKNGRLTLEGRMGPESMQWAANLIRMPEWIKLNPLSLSPSQVSWHTNGKKTISVHLALLGGPKISTDMHIGPDELLVDIIGFEDETSAATMRLHYHDGMFGFSFNGNLHKSTLDKILRDNSVLNGWIKGDFRAQIDPRDLSDIRFQGNLKGQKLFVPLDTKTKLVVGTFFVTGDHHKLMVKSADLAWMNVPLTISGNIRFATGDKPWIDMDMAAENIDLGRLIQIFEKSKNNKKQKPPVDAFGIPVQGKIRFKADRLTLGKATWRPVYADIRLKKDSADVAVKEAVMCGVSTPGALTIAPEIIAFDIKPAVQDGNLNSSLNCLSPDIFKADGQFVLSGNLIGRGKGGDWLKTVSGHLEIMAKGGHIYQDIVLLNVLRFLNVTEKLTGHVTAEKMKTEGFGYHSLGIKAILKDGKLIYEKAVLDGISMTVTARGEHNLLNGRLRLDLLVAPIKTLDRVLGYVPLVGGVLQTLDTIPLSVKGSLKSIKVLPLHPSAIAFELKELMENTVDIPVNLVHADDWRGIKIKEIP